MSSLALVACDNPTVREEISIAFEGLRCDVEVAARAADVLERLVQDVPPGVIVLDLLLPGADQSDFPKLLRQAAPDAVIVVLLDPDLTHGESLTLGSSAVFRFLLRPFTEEELRSSMQSALTRALLLEENGRLEALHRFQERVLLEENERLAEKVHVATSQVSEVEAKREVLPGNAGAFGAAILEAYDTGLALHARAVATSARDLGHSLALPEETVERIQVAGMLHDIGYLGLPRFHLTRPRDRLTERETEEQRTHPVRGAEMLGVDGTLTDVALMVRHHHENHDGSGYPDGIRGQGIPLGSRIVRLADLYDRAYRSGVSAGGPVARTRARLALRDARDRRLDPDLVDLFLEGAVLRADTREVQIPIEDLQDGMVLTRDLRARNDLFIAAGGTRLDASHVEKILQFHQKNPILHEVFVRTS